MPLLLHLADVHLGAPHIDMGAAAVQQRERQSAAFSRAFDEGLKAKVDVALICGDLFDSNAQSRRSVEHTVAELKRLTDRGIRVVIIPGSHDVYDSRSIYRAFDLARMAGLPDGSDLLTVLTPERPELLIKELDLIVFGRVFTSGKAPRSPLDGFSVQADDRASWKVGMVHGSRQTPGKVASDGVPFTEAEIAASGLDYLALGHWHSYSSGRAGDTTWAYAGAPEPVAVDQDGAGGICLVRLQDGVGGAGGAGRPGSVQVECIRVGRTGFLAESVEASSLADQDELVRRLAELADPDLVLRATVDGNAPDSLEIDTDEVERALAPAFLHVRVRDRSVTELSAGPALPSDTVAGQFVADVEARMRTAEAKGDQDAAEEARQILRLGRRLLLDDPDRVTLP